MTPPKLTIPSFIVAIAALTLCASLPLSVPAQSEQSADPSDSAMVDSAEVSVRVPRPVAALSVKDRPNDDGGAILVDWELSLDDDRDSGFVTGYSILRSENQNGPFVEVGTEARGKSEYDDGSVTEGKEYYYRVDALYMVPGPDGKDTMLAVPSAISGVVRATSQYFNTDRLICLILFLFIAMSIIFYINRAKKGGSIYVRKIGGIDAVEEAVGRATEMGKKIFYVPGIQDMNDVQTIAGIAILGRVAEKAAEYETWLQVPVSRSMVMVTARETMREAYMRVGRPDNFQEAQVHYLTDDQFGYAAAIDGMVVREKPATIFYMGAFFAESLILAETGNSVGAIQIAGTAMPAQLPFFVAACDYTLIGEELFAASAYLSREPRQLGSLKGQDIGKALFLILIIIGVILATIGVYDLGPHIKVG